MHYPVQRDVAGDGNCFFRALYKAAESRGMLRVVGGAFQSSESGDCFESSDTNSQTSSRRFRTTPKEDRFVKCIRNFLSVSIRINKTYRDRLERMYELTREIIVKNGFEDNPTAIRKIGLDYGYPDWVTSYFIHTPESRTNLQRFIQACEVQVKKDGTYAGNMDVSLVTQALRKVHVELVIRTDQDQDKSTMFPMYPEDDTLYLFLKNGNHYNYMEYDASGDGAKSTHTNSRSRTLKANSEMARDLNAADRLARTNQLQENASEARKLNAYYKELDRQSKQNAELAMSMSRVELQRGGAKTVVYVSPRKLKIKRVLQKSLNPKTTSKVGKVKKVTKQN